MTRWPAMVKGRCLPIMHAMLVVVVVVLLRGCGCGRRMPFQSFSSFLVVYIETTLQCHFPDRSLPLCLPRRPQLSPFDFPSSPIFTLVYCRTVIPTAVPTPPWLLLRLPPQGSGSPRPALPSQPSRARSVLASLDPSTSVLLQVLEPVISRLSNPAFPSTCERRKSWNPKLFVTANNWL